MEKIDPIALLRNFTIKKKTIKQKEGNLIFGSKKLSMATKTAWRPKNSEKRYTLGDLWLFLKYKLNNSGPFNQYYTEISKLKDFTKKIQIVSAPHQSDIIKYFSGEIDVTDNIDENLREYVPTTDLRKRSKPYGKAKPDETANQPRKQLKTGTPAPQKAADPKLEAQKLALLQIRKWERVRETKNSKLRKSKNFKWCIPLLESKPSRKHRGNSNKSGYQTVLEEILNLSDFEEPRPIILIPNANLSGNLNLHNAKKFLTKGIYEAVDGNKLFQKEHDIFSRVINGQKIKFEIYDDVTALKSQKKMNRLVAIFLTSNPYQFKNSEKEFSERNIAKLLTKYRGYYMKYSDVRMHDNIKRWNVKVLSVHRNQRHKDILIKREFWEDMTKFLNSKRRI